jgi:uncharacterized membrane protein YfcA
MTESYAVLLSFEFGAVAVATFLAGFMRGFVGFGGAMVAVPALALAFGPLVAMPVATLFGLPSTAQLLPTAIREAERALVLPIGAAVFFGAPLGTFILVSVSAIVIKISIGALVLAMAVFLSLGWRLGKQVPMVVLLAAGGAGGFVQGAAGIGGPPVVAVALSRHGTPAQQRANVIGVMTAVSLSAFLPLLYFDLFSTEVLILGLALTPIYSGSTWLGSRYFNLGGSRHFRLAALMMLALVGLTTLVASLRDYLLSA